MRESVSTKISLFGSIPPKVLLGKGVLKICSKRTGKHSCRSVISIKLQSNFIEITLWYGCSLVNLLHFFKINFPKNISGALLLLVLKSKYLEERLFSTCLFWFKTDPTSNQSYLYHGALYGPQQQFDFRPNFAGSCKKNFLKCLCVLDQ